MENTLSIGKLCAWVGAINAVAILIGYGASSYTNQAGPIVVSFIICLVGDGVTLLMMYAASMLNTQRAKTEQIQIVTKPESIIEEQPAVMGAPLQANQVAELNED